MTAIRLVQLARILGLDASTLDDGAARAAISREPQTLADAFFAEAADNDDVASIETALDYLEGRLTLFEDLATPDARARVEARFRERLKAWES